MCVYDGAKGAPYSHPAPVFLPRGSLYYSSSTTCGAEPWCDFSIVLSLGLANSPSFEQRERGTTIHPAAALRFYFLFRSAAAAAASSPSMPRLRGSLPPPPPSTLYTGAKGKLFFPREIRDLICSIPLYLSTQAGLCRLIHVSYVRSIGRPRHRHYH